MERPRAALQTKSTNSTDYQPIIRLQLSPDIIGISYLTLGVEPDPNALYKIKVGKILDVIDLELTAIWSLELPHLTEGVYAGFDPNDMIEVWHKSTSSTVTVKSGATCALNEVVYS